MRNSTQDDSVTVCVKLSRTDICALVSFKFRKKKQTNPKLPHIWPQNTAKGSMSKDLCSKYSFFMPNLHIQMINETAVAHISSITCVFECTCVCLCVHACVRDALALWQPTHCGENSCRENVVWGGRGPSHLSPSRAPVHWNSFTENSKFCSWNWQNKISV